MLERLLFIPFGLMLSGLQCFVQVMTEFQASQGWPNYRSGGSKATTAPPAGDSGNSTDIKEINRMQDQQNANSNGSCCGDWSTDDLKVVRYWVLYVKCDEEELLDTGQVMVNYETTPWDFGCL